MQDKNRSYAAHLFIASLVALIFAPALGAAHLTFFAPFLVYMCYKSPRISCLWAAVLSGLIVDTFALTTPFGLHALNYLTAVFIIYSRRRLFDNTSLFMLPLLTALFSFLSTTIYVILITFFAGGITVTYKLIIADFFTMSIYDGIYAFMWHVPLLAYISRTPRKKRRSFMQRPQ